MWICSFLCIIFFCFINNAAAKIAEIPFALQWSIQENRLLPLKDSVNEYLMSNTISNIPEFEYYLYICPNGDREIYRGQTWIFFYIALKNVSKVEVNYTVTIESSNHSRTTHYIYKQSIAWGYEICKTEELFGPEKKYIVDGKFTVKVNGTFKFETADGNPASIDGEQQKWEGGELGDEAWKNDGTKDFTIAADDGRKIKAHKLILAIRSGIFARMFNENKVENEIGIVGEPFNVLEAAVKLIYNCNFVSSLSLEELISLYRFLNSCGLSALKSKVETHLIAHISASTVCRLTNVSIANKSIKLKETCMEFLVKCVSSKIPISDFQILDKNVLLDVLKISSLQILDTK